MKDWAERRDAKIGRLRAVPVVSADGLRGAHLHPDAPRAIERWNGHAWEPHGFAANLAEAKAVLYPEARESSNPPHDPVPKPLGSGTGKHRKPPAPRSDSGGRGRS